LDPSRAEAWSRLGAAYLLADEPEQALGPLRRVAAMKPTDPQSYADLAEVLGRLKMFEEAARECRAAADLAPDNSRFATLPAVSAASSARTEEQYRTAVSMLAEMIQKYPTVDFLHVLLAGLHMRFIQFAQARAEFEAYLARNPKDLNAWLNVAAVCDKLGDAHGTAIARARWQQLVEIASAPAEIKKQALLHPGDTALLIRLATVQARAGRMQEAYGTLMHAADLKPGDPEIARLAAQAQVEMNRTADSAPQSIGGSEAQ
jgi:Flp pilus assembly protein TadD